MKELPQFSILLADDSPLALEHLTNILEPQYTIYKAKSGRETLEKAVDFRPDLILLDIVMPDMSGLEVLVELKKSKIVQRIPVIFITGLDGVEDEEKGLLLGAVDYISKPFHDSIVRARVKTHLEIVRQMHAIERFGMMDSLTNIPNRRSFDSQINIELTSAARKKAPVSVLMIDVDGFKVYNDTYGHALGDALLRTLARAFTTTLKDTTDLVFRWGGDEFAVILPNTDSAKALKVAEDLRANIEASHIPGGGSNSWPFITISVGVASAEPDADSNAEELVSKADKALYLAKNTGKNECAYID